MKIIKKYYLIAIAALIAWGLGFIMFTVGVMHDKPQHVNQTIDAIVVLTGGSNRIEAGLELFAAGKASNLFISGVHPDVKKGDIVAQWKGDVALPPCCLILGKEATTTAENAQEVKEWGAVNDVTSILLVTSHYHMPRALIEFNDAMPDVFVVTRPTQQDDFKISDKNSLNLLFSEYHKSILRWVQLKLT